LSKKYCIIGLPRCGSAYAASLIKASLENYYTKVYDLKEPFSKNQDFIDLETKIKSCNYKEIIILRLFLIDRSIEELKTIIIFLKKYNFNFLILKRKNIENQLISFAVANKTNLWWKHKKNKNTKKLKIFITKFTDILWLFKHIKQFDTTLKKIDIINSPTLYYETLKNDLNKVLKVPINVNVVLVKQSAKNPYDQIINGIEVKNYISSLIN